MTLKQFTCDFTDISPHIQCCKSLKEQNKQKIKKKKKKNLPGSALFGYKGKRDIAGIHEGVRCIFLNITYRLCVKQ